jgi:2-oxoisovalerate dehydrogenase E1 component
MLILIRQGKVSKWFSGIGQAISVGVTVLDSDEYICMHRNGVFTGRDIPLYRLSMQGKPMVLLKVEIRSFIWNPTIQNYWNDFASWSY